MSRIGSALSWLLLAAATVVGWKAASGDFVGMDTFPLIFAAVTAAVGGASLLFDRTRPRAPRAVPVVAAIAVAALGAGMHYRVLAERRAAASNALEARWLGTEIGEIAYQRAWNLEASGAVDPSSGTVLLNFWGTWCTPCVEEMPELDAAYRQYGDDGVTILGLTTDFSPDGAAGLESAAAEVGAFLERVPVDYPILLLPRSEFARFGIELYPTTLWLEEGIVRSASAGISGTREMLDRLGG